MTGIKELRLLRGFTQVELARQIGCKRESISRYETGNRTPPLSVAARIALALGCTIDELMGSPAHTPTIPHERA